MAKGGCGMTDNKKPAGVATPRTGFDAARHPHHSPIKASAKAYALATLGALPSVITGVLVLILMAHFLEAMP